MRRKKLKNFTFREATVKKSPNKATNANPICSLSPRVQSAQRFILIIAFSGEKLAINSRRRVN